MSMVPGFIDVTLNDFSFSPLIIGLALDFSHDTVYELDKALKAHAIILELDKNHEPLDG